MGTQYDKEYWNDALEAYQEGDGERTLYFVVNDKGRKRFYVLEGKTPSGDFVGRALAGLNIKVLTGEHAGKIMRGYNTWNGSFIPEECADKFPINGQITDEPATHQISWISCGVFKITEIK